MQSQLVKHDLQNLLFAHIHESHGIVHADLSKAGIDTQSSMVDTLNLFSANHHVLSVYAALKKEFSTPDSVNGPIITFNADNHERARIEIANTKSYVPVVKEGEKQHRWVDVSQRVESELVRNGRVQVPAYITVSFCGNPVDELAGFCKTRHYQEEAPERQYDGMTNRKLKNLVRDIADFLTNGTFPPEEKF